MKLSLDKTGASHKITAYTEDSITIGQRQYSGSLIVTPEHIFDQWRPAAVAGLSQDDFACLAGQELEVILLGTGAKQMFPPPPLQFEFARVGIGLEVMTTDAACRTFNILLMEDRRVAAALMLPES